jgi:hypothetical protein
MAQVYNRCNGLRLFKAPLILTLYISNTLTEGYRPPLKSRAGH